MVCRHLARTRRSSFWLLGLGLAALLAYPTSATAQEAEPNAPATTSAPKAWAVGVSAEARNKALAIFEQGNYFFERSQFSQALAKYRSAVESWDHPAIRYNMAVCLIRMEEPLEAHDNLRKALAYGQAPLADGLFTEGETYMTLLMGRLAEVTISGGQAGAVVTLDGQPLFSGKGKAERLLLPGKHMLIAKADGMMTYTSDLILDAGKKTEVSIKMVPLSESVVMRRRWNTWKPWAVAGSGLGLAALGGVAYLLADSSYNSFNAGVARECPDGCPDSELSSRTTKYESRGDLESITSTSLLIAGGAVATTGLVMIFLNRPRPYQLEDTRGPKQPPLAIVPMISREGAGLVTSFRF